MVLMVASSITISFGGVAMRSLEAADPWQINFYRSVGLLGAASTLLVIRYRRDIISIVRNIGRIGIVGGILLASAGITHIQAMSNTTIANAMFVLGAIPFFTALFARIMLGEKLRWATLWTMLVAACGLVVMVFEGFRLGAAYGNFMALMTATTFAVYAVIIRKKRQQEMLPTLLVSSLVIILVSLFATGADLVISQHDIMICFLWGAVLSGLANWMFIYASRHLAAAETTLFMLLEFALAPIWVWIVVNEVPGRWTIVGGSLIILAVALKAILELIDQPRQQPTISGPV